MAGAWSKASPWQERTRNSSSACFEISGNNVEISMPDWPCFLKSQAAPRASALVKSIRLVFRPFTKLPGSVFPDNRASSGFGSQVSTCETPPCMKRQMTLLMRGVSCGDLGARGFGVAASRSEQAAADPKPMPIVRRNSLLDLVHIKKLVQVQETTNQFDHRCGPSSCKRGLLG